MTQLSVNLPVPAANGAGAAVDVSAMGKTKTLICGGPFDATVNIEYATDDTGTNWAPLATFQKSGNLTTDIAAHWLRSVTSQYQSGSPNVDVGSDNGGSFFAQIPTPAGAGVGAEVDIRGLPLLKTVVVGPFGGEGVINIEVSQDGTSWAQVMTFYGAGGKSQMFYAQLARVRSDGPTPTVWIGGASSGDTSSTISAVMGFVYRPGATGADAPGGNVYTDWTLLMAAIDATSKLGLRSIEFDPRFSPVPGIAVVPPGVYNMTNVAWIGTATTEVTVALADGAQFVVDPPGDNGDINVMRFEGPLMTIVGNRVNGPAHFTDVSIVVTGPSVRFQQNADLGPAALPMFEVTAAAGEITMFFDTPRGGLGQFPASLFVPPGPPLIDSGTDIVTIRAQSGMFANDLVTGSGFFSIATQTMTAWGDIFDEFAQPSFTGVLDAFGVGIQLVRYDVFTPPVEGIGPVTAEWGPYDASYNELVLVDTSGGSVTINLPNANTQGVQAGERVTVKMLNVPGEGDQINIASTYGNTIESPTITNDKGCKTWVMDGVGNWNLTAVV